MYYISITGLKPKGLFSFFRFWRLAIPSFEQTYANGDKKTHFQIGVAATQKGISIYLLGIRGKLDLQTA